MRRGIPYGVSAAHRGTQRVEVTVARCDEPQVETAAAVIHRGASAAGATVAVWRRVGSSLACVGRRQSFSGGGGVNNGGLQRLAREGVTR